MAEGRALAQGLGPVPENVDVALGLASAAGASQAAETPGYLKEAVEKAGFGPALLRTLQDLGGCSLGPEDLERLAPGSADAERLRLLARTARDFGARLEKARLLDRPSIYRLAAEALPSRAIGGVVLLGFDDLPPVAADFLAALRKSHPFAVVPETGPLALAPRHDARRRAFLERVAAPATPEEGPEPSSSLQRVQQRLFERRAGAPTGSETPLDATVHVLAAAGEAMEAVEIARLVQQATRRGPAAGPGRRPPPRPGPLRGAPRLGLRASGDPGVLRGGRAAGRPGGAGPRPAARPRRRGPRAPRGHGVPDDRAHPLGGPPRQGRGDQRVPLGPPVRASRDRLRHRLVARPARRGAEAARGAGLRGRPRPAPSRQPRPARRAPPPGPGRVPVGRRLGRLPGRDPGPPRRLDRPGPPGARAPRARPGAARPLRPRADPRGLPGPGARAAGDAGLPRGLARGRPRPRVLDRRRARAGLPPRLRSRPRRARLPDRRPARPAPPRRGARGALAGAAHHARRAGAGAAPLRARRPRGGGAPRAVLPALRHRLRPRARAVVLPAAGGRGGDGPARGRGGAHGPRVAGRDRPRPAAPRRGRRRHRPHRARPGGGRQRPGGRRAAPRSTATASWPPRSRSSARPGTRGSRPSTASSTWAATRPRPRPPRARRPPLVGDRGAEPGRVPLPAPAEAGLRPAALGGAGPRLPARRPPLRLALPRRGRAPLHASPRRRPPAGRRPPGCRRSRRGSRRSWTRRRGRSFSGGRS